MPLLAVAPVRVIPPLDVNVLHYGDNLPILRQMPPESVDLVYLDPPFNSNRAYNVLFKNESGEHSRAQIEAFDDTWAWGPEPEAEYRGLVEGGAPARVASAMQAMRSVLPDRSDLLAYLVMMTPRLIELHRVMRETGSLYLHCDPTASHYLKLILDSIFGAECFQNEIIWERASGKNDAKRYGRSHDTLFFYSRSKVFTWNQQYSAFQDYSVEKNYTAADPDGRRYRLSDLTANKPGGDVDYEWHGKRPYKGRHWAYSRENMDRFLAEGRIVFRRTGMPVYKRYLDEMPGVPMQDVWTDIRLPSDTPERLGYPTQKPLALLERIISTSSSEGQVVLDPFCGCGTAVDAAERLKREWIGVDISYLAIDLITKRLKSAYGARLGKIDVRGVPRDFEGARALFERNPFEFERWAVSLVDGEPNEKQVGDKGIDGVIRFPAEPDKVGRALVSVKGGKQINPSMVRDLIGTVESQGANIGVLILMEPPTKGMTTAANSCRPARGQGAPEIVSANADSNGRRASRWQAARHADAVPALH